MVSQRGRVYVDEDKKGNEAWFAEWRDHAGRLIRKRLGTKAEIRSKQTAKRLAAQVAEKLINEHAIQLERKHSASTRDTWQACQRAFFPREVVAARVIELTSRIAKADPSDDRAGQPGMQLFSERTGISPRQVHRILEDETYMMVGMGIIDKICCEFEDLFDDFIASATDWAAQRGEWADRPGSEDSWPFGYFFGKLSDPADDDII